VVDPLVHIADATFNRLAPDVFEFAWTNTGIDAPSHVTVSWDGVEHGSGDVPLDDDGVDVGTDAVPPDNTDVTWRVQVADSCSQMVSIATGIFNTGD
jgi:hypothetical protein